MYKVVIPVLWSPKLRDEGPEINAGADDTFENLFLGSAQDGEYHLPGSSKTGACGSLIPTRAVLRE